MVQRSSKCVWLTVVLLTLLAPVSRADSVGGPGKHLASNAFDCLPGDRARSSINSSNNAGGQVAAGLAVRGGVVLSVIQSLASQSQMTDNPGSVQLDQQRHGAPDRGTPRSLLGNKGSITRHSKSVRSYRLMLSVNQISSQNKSFGRKTTIVDLRRPDATLPKPASIAPLQKCAPKPGSRKMGSQPSSKSCAPMC